ncbi:MAG: hypothetical protein LBT21_04035 [Oscillospiraceae bacterium]|nr:hypothetical protein [Oscillospiraceae bacterium]
MEATTENVTEEDLAAINRYTRRALTAENVYTVNVVLCANEIDRDLERFDSAALPILAEMFVGKTGIFDHCPSAENQHARIFAAECVTDPLRKTQAGEEYRCVKAKAYIPRTEANAALIEEIESGIKKEVSVGCAMGKALCSVCGEELRSGTCVHKRGREYNGKLCHTVLREPTDAYEWSFVAVPAQLAAGVSKSVHSEKTVRSIEENYTASGGTITPASGTELEEAEQIRTAMREETLRLALAALPAIGEETAQAICARLSFKQCRDFSDALREKQTLARPRTPQLSVNRAELHELNTEFCI